MSCRDFKAAKLKIQKKKKKRQIVVVKYLFITNTLHLTILTERLDMAGYEFIQIFTSFSLGCEINGFAEGIFFAPL